MFPIAWAVVESENKHSWKWILELLQEELQLDDGTGWSVISDQQKGLVDSLQELLPLAEHRKCARHVSANWKIKHKSAAGRKAFWDAVYASNRHEFKIHAATLKQLEESGEDPGAYSDFMKHSPMSFCRAYVSRTPKCDSIESNICETFNGCIVKWRGLHIINMLEGIRTYIMGRLVSKVQMLEKNRHKRLCPRILEKIEKGKLIGRNCMIRQTLELVCECHLGDFGYVVDLDKNICSCGYWKLSGLPCVHVITVASFLRKDIEYWVGDIFSVRHAQKAYGYGGIPAIPGQQAWEEAEGTIIRPPTNRIMPGRPKKNRRKERQELEVRPSKSGYGGTVMSKQGVLMHCRKCKGVGHNAHTCTATVEPTTQPDDPRTSVEPTATRARARASTRAVRLSPPQPTGTNVPAVGRVTRKCGECGAFGHNKRSCIRLRGLQVHML
ncbi:hypothetical protein LINPERHAP2_LOCUS14220 [Linum perenne]